MQLYSSRPGANIINILPGSLYRTPYSSSPDTIPVSAVGDDLPTLTNTFVADPTKPRMPESASSRHTEQEVDASPSKNLSTLPFSQEPGQVHLRQIHGHAVNSLTDVSFCAPSIFLSYSKVPTTGLPPDR